jgi:hypothetical protein
MEQIHQEALSPAERELLFAQYFSLIDWTNKPKRALDMGAAAQVLRASATLSAGHLEDIQFSDRSEERRVGKEC